MTDDPWQTPESRAVALFKLIERNGDPLMLPSYCVAIADALISAGWRPPPQRITTLRQVQELPHGTILRTQAGTLWTAGKSRAGYSLAGAEVIWPP